MVIHKKDSFSGKIIYTIYRPGFSNFIKEFSDNFEIILFSKEEEKHVKIKTNNKKRI